MQNSYNFHLVTELLGTCIMSEIYLTKIRITDVVYLLIISFSCFKNNEHINEKCDGPYRGFGYLSLFSDPLASIYMSFIICLYSRL